MFNVAELQDYQSIVVGVCYFIAHSPGVENINQLIDIAEGKMLTEDRVAINKGSTM